MQKHFKRQEIGPGIILEKYQEIQDNEKLYVMKVENLNFKTVDFEVDFAGSTDIKVKGSDSLVCPKRIRPFGKDTVAILELKKGWTLKTTFKFSMDVPDLKIQKEYLSDHIKQIENEKRKISLLECLDVNCIVENELFRYMDKTESSFVDYDFPPSEKSLALDKAYAEKNFNCLVHWRRAKALLLKKEESKQKRVIVNIYNESVKPNQIVKGEIANGWMLSVIAALAENAKMIKRVILTKQPNLYGFTRIKLCDMANWRIYSLDDYFPCYPLANPFFVQNSSKELWPMILEKAFAKKYGAYSQLAGGSCKQAFIDLTGCPTFQYKFEEERVKKYIEDGDIWNMIKEWKSLKYFITVGSRTVVKDGETFNLPSEHAYTLLNIFRTEKVIELRDPLKILNFTGKLAENSSAWTEELKSKLRPKFESNRFYITYDEFIKRFDVLTVCQITGWNEIKIKGKFIRIWDPVIKEEEYFSSKWIYKIKIREKANIIIGIHQKDERTIGVKETTPNTDIGFVILTINNNSYSLVAEVPNRYERDVFETFRLNPGIYFIIPRSSGMILKNTIKAPPFNYQIDDFRINTITDDIFEKLDIDDNGILDHEELNKFFSYINQELSVKEFEGLIQKYNVKEFPSLNDQILNKKIFSLIFKDLMKTMDKQKRKDLFEKLGYNENLQSLRNRLFRMTIHSKIEVEMKTDDALKDAIDQSAVRLLLRNKGVDFQTKEKVKLAKGQMKCMFYHNQ